MASGSWLWWPSGNTSARIAAIDSDTHSKTKTEAVCWSGNGSLAVADKGLGGRHFEQRRVPDRMGRSEKTAFARATENKSGFFRPRKAAFLRMAPSDGFSATG
jgi:hypothetical protein